ncbi:tellurite resistance TerB family protein [Microbaculum sp. FT89]|uniref:tellurite resistance TerB family protein n=1 Tax=Microbaculum sp. FT89 TaxID=3447298 RepID=UPI003F53CDD2
MTKSVSPQEALIYVMVTMSAADRTMTDNELLRIGGIVQNLPAFREFDTERLVTVAEDCGALLNEDDSLDKVLDLVAESLPPKFYDTAYALAVDVAAADLDVEQEELRLLQLLRDRFDLDPLVCAAIERGARARFRTL